MGQIIQNTVVNELIRFIKNVVKGINFNQYVSTHDFEEPLSLEVSLPDRKRYLLFHEINGY